MVHPIQIMLPREINTYRSPRATVGSWRSRSFYALYMLRPVPRPKSYSDRPSALRPSVLKALRLREPLCGDDIRSIMYDTFDEQANKCVREDLSWALWMPFNCDIFN